MEKANTKAPESIKKFIAGLYDIVFLRWNMQIKGNKAIYDIESKELDFDNRAWGMKEKKTCATNDERIHKSAWVNQKVHN